MATVYLAHDRDLDVERAIKLLNPTMLAIPVIRKRFISEARAMARLQHKNLVTIYDIQVDHAPPFLVIEFVPGGNLEEVVRARGPLPPRQAMVCTRGILEALKVAHAKGIVHRDIKPANVLIGEGDTVKVTDFGIAQVSGNSNITRTGRAMGTFAYMPPEQRQNAKAADHRADLFATAASLYFLVTAKDPYDLYNPALVDEKFEGVDDVLRDFVLRTTAYAPEDRPTSAAEMLTLLDQAAAKLPADAPEPLPLFVADASAHGHESQDPSLLRIYDLGEAAAATGWSQETLEPEAVHGGAAPTFAAVDLAESTPPGPRQPPPVVAEERVPQSVDGTLEPNVEDTRHALEAARGQRPWPTLALVGLAAAAVGGWWWFTSRGGAAENPTLVEAPEAAAEDPSNEVESLPPAVDVGLPSEVEATPEGARALGPPEPVTADEAAVSGATEAAPAEPQPEARSPARWAAKEVIQPPVKARLAIFARPHGYSVRIEGQQHKLPFQADVDVGTYDITIEKEGGDSHTHRVELGESGTEYCWNFSTGGRC